MEKIKESDNSIIVIKSLVIKGNNENVLENIIKQTHKFVDAYITDTYDPESGASGATGKTHNWTISRNLREFSPKPLILAGGLNPSNVYKAVSVVKPAGVDVHTGVEKENGRKDRIQVRQFIKEARKAFEEIRN